MEVPDYRGSLGHNDDVAFRHDVRVPAATGKSVRVRGGSPCAGLSWTDHQRGEAGVNGQRGDEAVGRVVAFGGWHWWPSASPALIFGQPNDGSVKAQRVVGVHSLSLLDPGTYARSSA